MGVEEWWGRTFEHRGSVKLEYMSKGDPADIRRLSTPEVLELIRSEDNRTVRGLVAHMERKRREDWTARAALAISIVALIVAAFT